MSHQLSAQNGLMFVPLDEKQELQMTVLVVRVAENQG